MDLFDDLPCDDDGQCNAEGKAPEHAMDGEDGECVALVHVLSAAWS